MQVNDFEPMSIGGVLDNTFRIYKSNFIRFITIVAVIQVPIALLAIISTSAFNRGVPVRQRDSEYSVAEGRRASALSGGQDEADPAAAIIGWMGLMVAGILSLLGQVLCSGALTKSVSETYLGNEITVGQAYRFVLHKLPTLILAGICVALVVYLGLLLLVVPGVIFGLWFALTTPAIVVEDLKATKGMSRSKALASGNLGKIFSVAFLVFLLTLVVSMVAGYAGAFLGRIVFPGNMTLNVFFNQLVSVIAKILVVPIGATAYILLYYDLRIRKEGFDLQMLAESIGSGQDTADVDRPQQ
jgi:hypothetical protein